MKTTQFKNPIYIGDPINAVKIFNDKEVDELVVLDIDATPTRQSTDLARLKKIIEQGFMPIAFGGGIESLEQAAAILKLGVEKIILNTAAVRQPGLVATLSEMFGAQSVVVAIDVKPSGWSRKNTVFINGGREATKLDPIEHAKQMVSLGCGELFVNAIHRDGTMSGYDLPLINAISRSVEVPVIASGGAAGIDDFVKVAGAGASAAAAGAMFVFQGSLRGILISYPSQGDLEKALGRIALPELGAHPSLESSPKVT